MNSAGTSPQLDRITGHLRLRWARRHKKNAVALPGGRGTTEAWVECVPLRHVVGLPVIVEDVTESGSFLLLPWYW
jgi:hypothetical protein